jgi:hypothetical protein
VPCQPGLGVAGRDLGVPQVHGVEHCVTNVWHSMCGCIRALRTPARCWRYLSRPGGRMPIHPGHLAVEKWIINLPRDWPMRVRRGLTAQQLVADAPAPGPPTQAATRAWRHGALTPPGPRTRMPCSAPSSRIREAPSERMAVSHLTQVGDQ